jgi:phosphoribosyl-AMP cyclohydrolase / phosphoribosyl-ATP pyrophosphohydrolase
MISLFETGQSLRFADDGLIPAIIQDSITKNVLMLGYMNEEAISLTRSTGLVTFFSRSKNRIWQKGETSGNVLRAKEIRVDCDGDTLLILASPVGPTCHTGTDTCWAEENEKSPISFLSDLENVIEARIEAGDEASYTMQLIKSGVKRISQKVGEEGLETALEGVVGTDEQLSEEAADLVYHLLVLLQARKLRLADVVAVLQERHGA